MFRAALLLFAASLPVLIFWVAGPWALLVMALMVAAVFVLSTGEGQGRDAIRSGRLTGYGTTEFDTVR